jgi:hypothetical protein
MGNYLLLVQEQMVNELLTEYQNQNGFLPKAQFIVPNNVRKDNMTCVGHLINRHCIIKATHCFNFVGNDSNNENYGAVKAVKITISRNKKIIIQTGLARDFMNGESTTKESRKHISSSRIPKKVEHRLFVDGTEKHAWGYTNEPSKSNTYDAGHLLSRQCGGSVGPGICFKTCFFYNFN